jgi:hypothetical protein
MSATLDPLVMDLVAFVAKQPRPYDEVIDAWRTSCPRLTVWEDAIDRGLITRRRAEDRTLIVQATGAGLQMLRDNGRLPNRPSA